MKHWPWQHNYVAVAAQKIISDYTGDGSALKEGIGTHETVVLFRCDCGKVKTQKIQGHWNDASLAEAFAKRSGESHAK